jgi:hypothetical protein
MNAATFPLVCILVVIGFALAFGARRLLGAISHEIAMRRLARICGSRARANRLVRAVELETRNNALSSLADASVPARTRVAAETMGRPAGEELPGRVGAAFPQLRFAQRQAD